MDGATLRDQAISRVERKAGPEWNEQALRFVSWVARRRATFTTTDIWSAGLQPPSEGRAMGAVMMRAKSQGICAPTDRFIPDPRPNCHRQPIRVWRSLLVEPTE